MTRGAAKVLLALAAAALVAGTAFAQPNRARGGAKPKPGAKPAAQVDAGADSPYEENKDFADRSASVSSALDGGTGTSSGPVPAPSAERAREGDGGVKASPLNPAPGELSNGSLDAGAGMNRDGVDYDRLLGDIAALRARVAAVGDGLFHARIAVGVETVGNHAKIARLTVAIDDGIVYTAPASFRADDMTPVYDHAVAPGRHAVTVEVDRKDDRNDAFATSQRSRFIVDVPKDEQLDVSVTISDDSTMGDFPADRSGRYELRVRAKAVARPLKR